MNPRTMQKNQSAKSAEKQKGRAAVSDREDFSLPNFDKLSNEYQQLKELRRRLSEQENELSEKRRAFNEEEQNSRNKILQLEKENDELKGSEKLFSDISELARKEREAELARVEKDHQEALRRKDADYQAALAAKEEEYTSHLRSIDRTASKAREDSKTEFEKTRKALQKELDACGVENRELKTNVSKLKSDNETLRASKRKLQASHEKFKAMYEGELHKTEALGEQLDKILVVSPATNKEIIEKFSKLQERVVNFVGNHFNNSLAQEIDLDKAQIDIRGKLSATPFASLYLRQGSCLVRSVMVIQQIAYHLSKYVFHHGIPGEMKGDLELGEYISPIDPELCIFWRSMCSLIVDAYRKESGNFDIRKIVVDNVETLFETFEMLVPSTKQEVVKEELRLIVNMALGLWKSAKTTKRRILITTARPMKFQDFFAEDNESRESLFLEKSPAMINIFPGLAEQIYDDEDEDEDEDGDGSASFRVLVPGWAILKTSEPWKAMKHEENEHEEKLAELNKHRARTREAAGAQTLKKHGTTQRHGKLRRASNSPSLAQYEKAGGGIGEAQKGPQDLQKSPGAQPSPHIHRTGSLTEPGRQ